MYPGLIILDVDTNRPAAADIKALLARGHDLILLSNQQLEGEERRGLAASGAVFTVITRPAIQSVDDEQWKAIAIYSLARLMNAVKLHLIGNISAPACNFYTIEAYGSIAEAIKGMR